MIATLAIAWAAVPFAHRLHRFGSGQANDYFPTIGFVAGESGWSSNFADWLLVRSNEHRVFVSTVIYRVNVALFDGDNRGLSAWSLLMMVLTTLSLLSLLPRNLRSRPVAWTLTSVAVAAFAITPMAAHNVVLGFSGTMWLTANALCAGSLALAAASARRLGRPARLGPFVTALALSVIASWTYSTGLMSWGALLVLVAGQRQGVRRVAAVLALGGVAATLSLAGYDRPSHHPKPNTGHDVGLLVDYVQTYLGSLFATDQAAAEVWGLVVCGGGLVVFGLMPFFLGRERRRNLLWPWLAVMLLGLCNAVAMGVGRSGFGVEQALASRYATLAAFVWLGVLVPALVVVLTSRRLAATPSRRWATVAVTALLAAALCSHSRDQGVDLLDRFVERASLHPVGHLALRHDIPDKQVYRAAFTLDTRQFWQVRDTLRALGHIPFNRSASWPSGHLDETGRLDNVGYLDSVSGVPGGWVRLRGWSLHATRPVAEIVFADAEGNVLGPAAYGVHRPDVAAEIGDGAAFSGFMGYVRAEPGSLPPTAWVRLNDAPTYYPLISIDSLEAQWESALDVAASADAFSLSR